MINFIWEDWAVGVGLALNLGSRFITNVLTGSISGLVSTANAIESNPTAKAASTNFYFAVVEWILITSFSVAYYLFLRKKHTLSDGWKLAFDSFTLLIFIGLLFDFLNDSGLLIGVLIHGFKLVGL